MNKELLVYQGKNGEIILKQDAKNDTIWANQKDIASIFEVNSQAITKHIKNIYGQGELVENGTCSILEQVQKEGNREINREVKFYNLDMIISIGYRVNSAKATQFRIWSTKILKEHITQGFTINKSRLENNYSKFLKAVDDVKKLLPKNNIIENKDILELVKSFADTWFNLDNYDRDELPSTGFTKTDLEINSEELYDDIAKFKKDLIEKQQATELFAQEKNTENLKGILGNVFQSFDGEDLYGTLEEKAGHLLYFVVKNHPFTDGNKRTGAFCFIWFLRKTGFDFREKITPEALTAITLLVAESNPKDKERIVGLIILMLKK